MFKVSFPLASSFRLITLCIALGTATLLSGCHGAGVGKEVRPVTLSGCDDSIKTAFRPDTDTRVVAVRAVKKGDPLVAVDSASPITAAADMCLVKLLVGPGVTAEKDQAARSYSEGIGIEIWLPTHANWNERIRNYGGGGWVGGSHRYPDKIGSKVPAIVNANMGYAVGTTDAGQPWYQDGSFSFLSNGRVNREAFRDFSYRAMVEQAVKTKALVKFYYGKEQKYAYYDGHSQGGRQGLKVAQDYPELYDGYMISVPVNSWFKVGIGSLFYPQVVMRNELGYTAADKDLAKAFATKVEAANARAVASCDKEKLGYLLDPFSCAYDPAKDAAQLCSGVAGKGVLGTNTNAATCMTLKEAEALNKIWYGATIDGSYDPDQTAEARGGKALGAKQLWWPFARGTAISGLITGASADAVALALQDVSYAASASATASIPFANSSTVTRDRWKELDYSGLTDAFTKGLTLQPMFGNINTDNADLGKLRDLGRKMVMFVGLADDAIPPAGMLYYYNQVAAGMGGDAEVQKFLRLYTAAGSAHSSQGRAYTVSGNNNAVPLPKLPGNANQTPTREQDQLFTALVDWVEKGVAPGEITITSRDNSVSYPMCVYPKKTTWNGTGPAKSASSYVCK